MRYGLVFLLIGIVIGLILLISNKHREQQKIKEAVLHMPRFQGTEEGKLFYSNVLRRRKAMLFFFDSSCSHCEYMISEVKESEKKFRNVDLILLSLETDSSLAMLRASLGSNFHILHIDKSVISSFGVNSYPTICAYDEQGELLGRHVGEIKVAKIGEMFLRNSRSLVRRIERTSLDGERKN